MGDGEGHHLRRAGICSELYVLLAVAGLIGAVGLITNSQVLIVAVVVGPEYNPAARPVTATEHNRSSAGS